jgi:hypothetical protein
MSTNEIIGHSQRKSAATGGALTKGRQIFLRFLDLTVPHRIPRWIAFGALLLLYVVRVISLGGYYVVTYGLSIYLLNIFLQMISPAADPELEEMSRAELPTNSDDEFKPFVPRVAEFRIWQAGTSAVLLAFVMTFCEMFDVPVFWPILLFYFCLLMFVTLKKRVEHMFKHKYVPWTRAKPKYVAKDSS